MNKCFVIQPFDNGKFDKRYEDVYAPAIRAAKYEPYRVDKDIASEIPIEDIDSNIQSALAVLADITLDNPNVWFEVGLAMAYKKRIILICSDERKDKYPFDIQQRTIIRYKTDSASDFENLKYKIVEKLNYFSKDLQNVVPARVEGQILSESIISDEALLLLGTIGENIFGQGDSIPILQCSEKFESYGYNRLAFNLALDELMELSFVEYGVSEYNYPECTITREGVSWMRKNKARFNLTSATTELDNIPF